MRSKMMQLISFLYLLTSSLHAHEWGTRNFEDKNQRVERPYRILTFDGGGIRGVFSAQLVTMLEQEFHFLKNVDLFAGTSAGSILACALSFGLSPGEVVDLYRSHAKEIFQQKGGVYGYLFMQSKYQRDGLQKILESIVPPEVTLGNLPKKTLCVSFELFNPVYNCWTPALIDNFDPRFADVAVVDAILRSSAAPTYFPSYQGYIDGGAVANNPSMMALARALDAEGGGQRLENISLLSIGTGITNNYIPEDVDWGAIEWLVRSPFALPTPPHPLFDILYNGTISVPHFECSQILGSAYFRLNGFLSRDLVLDDWKAVDFLYEEAKKFPENAPEEWNRLREWIRKNFLD